MFNKFARLRSRPHQNDEGNPILISPDARVSLDRDGAVFLHARTGVVFTSNRIGARIWQGLQHRESVETMALQISQDHGVQCDRVRQDTTSFITALETQGFLSRRVGC
ncbi:hypothetical protein SBA3_710018 [Candidatus Sulfopaludibacter sp. SbA3]|nr:hypothetical protein SBA3_710018 [Candidatus Sulfopaludibacter sp. SbA3]